MMDDNIERKERKEGNKDWNVALFMNQPITTIYVTCFKIHFMKDLELFAYITWLALTNLISSYFLEVKQGCLPLVFGWETSKEVKGWYTEGGNDNHLLPWKPYSSVVAMWLDIMQYIKTPKIGNLGTSETWNFRSAIKQILFIFHYASGC